MWPFPRASRVSTNPDKIEALLSRGVTEVIDRVDLEKKLKSGKRLRVKLGIDPTSPHIHLGRAVSLLKLRDFQELGHQVILIIGDFTGTIGDTSDKASERPMLGTAIVKENAKTYEKQIGKILDLKKCNIHRNTEWLNKLTYQEVCRQADAFSINDFIARENIGLRLKEGKRVSLREVLYPLMQGYDSVAIKADVELGGTDQRFNLLAGRELQRVYGQEPQNIVMNPLIAGLDGRKMSSSWGNTVNLTDAPNDMFGKVMGLHDDLVVTYFTVATRLPLEEVKEHERALRGGANPRDVKLLLAREVVSMYYSSEDAIKAEEYFVRTFTKKETPEDRPRVKPSGYDLLTILIDSKLAASKSDARRVVEQGGVKVDKKTITDPAFVVPRGAVIQKGKMHFIEVA